MKLTVFSATPKQISRSVNPNHMRTGKSENNLRLCGELAEQLKILFPDGDGEGVFIVQTVDPRSQVLSIKNRRDDMGKPVFKLLFGSGQLFTLVALDLCVPGILSEVLQKIICQASTATV